ncbi:MAG: hypothetical protein J5I59_11660, partial [Saprospiraceae bacterium]|nr:hypothetical protein [Saprospiraceae bacterium]
MKISSTNIIVNSFPYTIIIRILFIHLIAITGLYAQSTTWTGNSDNDWNNSANWTSGVPDATMDVIIADVTNNPEINLTGALAKSLSIGVGADLTILTSGNLTINGSSAQGVLNQGSIINSGTLYVNGSGGNGVQNDGTFENNGSLTIGN